MIRIADGGCAIAAVALSQKISESAILLWALNDPLLCFRRVAISSEPACRVHPTLPAAAPKPSANLYCA